MKFDRGFAAALASALLVVLAACGGGGGSSGSSSSSGAGAPRALASSCSGVTSTGTGNQTPLVVDGFPCAAGGGAGQVNVPNTAYVSVEICAPGSTSNCQIIDHVIVDTGSTGVRIAASALNGSLQPGGSGLPVVAGTPATTTLTECEIYVSSYIYGPVVRADVYVAGKLVSAAPIQVFGSSGFPAPSDCSNQGGTPTSTPQSFGGNGLIGVGFETVDNSSIYYDYSAACAPINSTCPYDQTYAGVPNLVSLFASDNNGVVLSLPALTGGSSTSTVTGTLTFGVGTQSDNTPPSSTLSLVNDGNTADLLTTYLTFAASVSGGPWATAYLDSGTDAVYFNDTALTVCSSNTSSYAPYYFCPSSATPVVFELANTGSTAGHAFSYTVVDPSSPNYGFAALAASDVGGPTSASSTTGSTTYAFGLSSFFGHSVYVLFNGQTSPNWPGYTGPVNGID